MQRKRNAPFYTFAQPVGWWVSLSLHPPYESMVSEADNPAPRDTAALAESLDRVLAWSHARDYVGFSKFDLYNSPLARAVVPSNHRLRALLGALWARSPINLRPLLRVQPSRNPKGIALFAMAYLRRYQCTQQTDDLARAEELLDWLDQTHARGYAGKCWGYDHPWYSLHFYAPRDSPNVVVSGNVAHTFLEAYEVTGNEKYLETARSCVRFLLTDLSAPEQSAEMRNIGYIPGSDWAVLNINGLAGSVLARTAKHTGEAELTQEARRLIAFLADKQTDYGAWHYAWPDDTSRVKHDNYHTGNVLDWLLDYTTLTGDTSFREQFRRGLVFYRDQLLLPSGQPKWRSDRVWPADVHSAAQTIVTFSKAAVEFDPAALDDAHRVAAWSVRHLQSPAGYFIYQQGRFWKKRYTLMRWCNAWMAFALSSLLLAEHRLDRK